MTADAESDEASVVRATYEEFQIGSETIAMISDQENDRAWIQSDSTQPIEP